VQFLPGPWFSHLLEEALQAATGCKLQDNNAFLVLLEGAQVLDDDIGGVGGSKLFEQADFPIKGSVIFVVMLEHLECNCILYDFSA